MSIFTPVRNKIEDIKSNTIWFDKRFSLRFKIANTILYDELRPLLGFTQYEVDNIKRHIRSDKVAEFYANRATKHINEILNL